MSGTQERSPGNVMQAVSNAMVKLHKEQFGRGPTNARSRYWAVDPRAPRPRPRLP
jgi:hypothetical protein